jgi:hypothetical protein
MKKNFLFLIIITMVVVIATSCGSNRPRGCRTKRVRSPVYGKLTPNDNIKHLEKGVFFIKIYQE